MRAVTTVLLAAVLGAGATACGSGQSASTPPPAGSPSAASGATPGTRTPPADAVLAKCVASLRANPSVTAPPPACASLSQADYLKAMATAAKAMHNATASGQP